MSKSVKEAEQTIMTWIKATFRVAIKLIIYSIIAIVGFYIVIIALLFLVSS